MKKIVGITGGIGSGKSVIGKMLTTMGYPVYYSDQSAKELMESDGVIIKEFNQLFGNKAYDEGKLNRTYLAQQIFSNPELKNKVNQIVHPRVRAHFKEFVEQQNNPLAQGLLTLLTGGKVGPPPNRNRFDDDEDNSDHDDFDDYEEIK